jgi:hypothetical protein
MEAEPSERFATADDLAWALEQYTTLPRRMMGGLAVLGGLALIPAILAFRLWPAPSDSGHDRPVQTQTAPTGTAPLEANLAVRHYRRSDRPDGPPLSLGEFGEKSMSALLDEIARVEVRFSAPAYSYLLALNPDGTVQLCEPADRRTAPTASTLLNYPSGEEFYFPFTDGKGLQAFVLVASRRPLPAFDDWAAGRALNWSHVPAAGFWLYDGRRWEPRSGRDEGFRGQPVRIAGVPTPLADACRRLVEEPGVDAVRAVAFPID